MEDPAREIANVVRLLTVAETPEIQQAAIERFFAKEAGFNHPLVKVKPSYRSRDSILGIYQWYRHMSPILELSVDEVVYDEERMKLYLNVSQNFHIFLSPFKPATARLLVQISLIRVQGRYHIKQQDDYYHPEDLANLVIPPLAHAVILVKHIGALISNINAWIFQLFGFWRPTRKVSRVD